MTTEPMQHWRNQLAAWLANRALNIATPRYRAFIRGSIEYGMRAALRDEDEGIEPPPDWRPRTPSHCADHPARETVPTEETV